MLSSKVHVFTTNIPILHIAPPKSAPVVCKGTVVTNT